MAHIRRRRHQLCTWPSGTNPRTAAVTTFLLTCVCAVLVLGQQVNASEDASPQYTAAAGGLRRGLKRPRANEGDVTTSVGGSLPLAISSDRHADCLSLSQQCGGMGFKALEGHPSTCCEGLTCMDDDVFFSACVLASTPHKDLGSSMPQTTLENKVLPAGEVFNYDEAIYMSNLFFEAQRAGVLPLEGRRIPWRGDSFMDDKGQSGEDLNGGYFDGAMGGSLIKFGLPAAWSTTVLAWGALEYADAYEAAGETDHLLATLRWGLDYFIKAHVSPEELYVQVGDQEDLAYWSPPEMSLPSQRNAYKVTCKNPGTEPAAETAAAMAAGSMVFRHLDPVYAELLLSHAKQLHGFAGRCKGNYVVEGGIREATPFYPSQGYEDELAWSALFLYKATMDKAYLTQAQKLYPTCCSAAGRAGGLPPVATKRSAGSGSSGGVDIEIFPVNVAAFSYDDKAAGVQLLLHNLTGEAKYALDATAFLDSWLAKPRTPQGLAYLPAAPPLPAVVATSFLALVAADQGLKPEEYRRFALNQIHYVLGYERDTDQPRKQYHHQQQGTSPPTSGHQSFVIGFGTSYPKAPAHRASSCQFQWSNASCHCSTEPAAYRLYGALVAGPGPDDQWSDSCDNFKGNAVSLVSNACFQSAVAGLKHLSIMQL
eukprot:evm.model.NODE_31977_length_99932_cov_29.870142.26